MNLFKRKSKVIVHDGGFHTDEIFACAVLDIYLKGNMKIIRTRDEAVIETGDYVLDVGGVYDHRTQRYDHHQPEGAGARENGIPYATAGLIWLHYGKKLIKSEELWNIIDAKLVQPIDAIDNGVNLSESKFPGIYPYSLQSIVGSRMPTWREEGTIDVDHEFLVLVDFMKDILTRELEIARDNLLSKREVAQAVALTPYEGIVILDENYPFEETLALYPDVLFVVSPRSDGSWRVAGIRDNMGNFDSLRKKLPETWAGHRGEALQEITGEPGARFCHSKRFLCVAENKESAIKLARKALTL